MSWTGRRVKRLRDRYGESQLRFAARLGVHPNTVRNWEQGTIDVPAVVTRLLDRLEEDWQAGAIRPHPDD